MTSEGKIRSGLTAIRSWFASGRRAKGPSPICHDRERLWLESSDETTDVLFWIDVVRCTAWERDCIGVDQICMVFESSGSSVVVTESDSGWKKFVRDLPADLPGFPAVDEWYGEVMLPAFEACERELFVRRV